MKGKNKPDNLEQFFQQVLGEYEEDPGEVFWDRIAPNIPKKPGGTSFVYKGWMLGVTFLGGLLLSSLFFYWQSNTSDLLSSLEMQIIEKDNQIERLQQQIIVFQNLQETGMYPSENKTIEFNTKNEEITQLKTVLSSNALDSPEKARLITKSQANKESFIKLETARKTSVATAASKNGSRLQPYFSSMGKDFSQLFTTETTNSRLVKMNSSLTDDQLIKISYFKKTLKNSPLAKKKTVVAKTESELDLLPTKKDWIVSSDKNNFDLSLAEKLALYSKSKALKNADKDVGELNSFIIGFINPLSSYKYNLAGYRATGAAVLGSTGIGTSWNWSVHGGIQTKSKWSVQMGFDFNQLTIIKEDVKNIRFRLEDSDPINGGYFYSFNQRTDGPLGQISVSTTILNQIKNDGEDILDGDLFQLSISTEQPVKIIRLPIMSGYRFDLSKRFYLTPKLGISAVWKIKDQTQLGEIKTFSDRLSVQNSDIFLTTKITTESLEANFRTEFGFRWRKRWYLVAEPRFKYGKSLFRYRSLELKDAPFHMMIGIRFNVD